MTFDMFQEYIEEHILEGWKSDVELDVAMVTKNNGVQLRGLYIKSKEMTVSPAIFKLEKFEYVKDRIIYRLVNYKKNEEILEDCPYLKLYDLALTFRWVAHSDDIGISTALVTNQEMEAWGISMNELLLAARENTPRLFPAQMVDMDEMIQRAGVCMPMDRSAIPMYIMTNRQEVNGASVLLYDDVLQTFALKKKTDFYILPSSIHEVILVPSDRIDNPSDLFTMVEDANRTVVALGDILSDSVYYYNREKNQIVPVTEEKRIV